MLLVGLFSGVTCMAMSGGLKRRLEAVARELQCSGRGVALLALGSIGVERERVDQWSDLDFFAIVEAGTKQHFLEHPEWLAADSKIEWLFRNTRDGFKVLWADEIFGEMAVFELDELPRIPFAPGRVVWAVPGLDHARLAPTSHQGELHELPDEHWAREELLSGLLIGLRRYRRGERLSAFRLVQGHCLDRLIELAERYTPPTAPGDRFDRLRRFELRFPTLAAELPHLLAGYDSTPKAVEAFLRFLRETGPVNEPLCAAVQSLL
jgi:lincosamide nucleotidyltransferase B/F